MLSMRASTATAPNGGVVEQRPKRGETNAAWLARAGITQGVVLLGGATLADVRVRFAQSLIRHDLTPSSWSSAVLLLGDQLLTVPLDPGDDISSIPAANAIRAFPLEAVDDPERYPNVAVIAFAAPAGAALAEAAADVQRQRGLIDLPGLVVAWLGWVWGVEDANPLVAGKGVPSAAFVEAVHAVADIELTPGLASASSCPEAIWQSARWWGDYYRESVRVAAVGMTRSAGHAQPQVPAGAYAVRQPAAAVTIPPAAPTTPATTATAARKRTGR
jgi:hypothetical protein